MKILFIGYPIHEQQCEKQFGASIAGNKMQLGIIENLYSLNNDIDVITIFPTAPYPKSKNLFIKKESIEILNDITALCISFVNLPIIKQINQMMAVYIELRKYIKQNKNCKVITFNCFPVIGIPLFLISLTKKNEKICILADLPIDTIERKGVSKLLRRIMDYFTEKSIKCFDKIITLNEYAIKLYAPDKPYIVIDGGIDVSKCNKSISNKISQDTFIKMLFCGALEEYNGIRMLIESMKYVNPNIRLYIYGDGSLVNYVKQSTKKYENVIYKGVVTNSEMLNLQKKVDVLINPRPVNDLISKVTFPSKIIEYMLSGTPVLTTKLNGLTDEYIIHLNIIDDASAEKMGISINGHINSNFNELKYKANNAREFIINERNWRKQTEKIYNFMKLEL